MPTPSAPTAITATAARRTGLRILPIGPPWDVPGGRAFASTAKSRVLAADPAAMTAVSAAEIAPTDRCGQKPTSLIDNFQGEPTSAMTTSTETHLAMHRLAGRIGAEITGIDSGQPVSDEAIVQVRQ